MGIVLSRFRKKKTTIEILEELDAKIQEIERYSQTTEQTHKKIVGTLILYSVILYIITTFVFYVYFFPASLYDQIFYIIPLLIFPLLVLLTKKMVSWYYKRKISRNQEKLIQMEGQKKKILEDITETETYKKAKEILFKYAPDQLMVRPAPYKTPSSAAAQESPMPTRELRRRIVQNQNLQMSMQNTSVPGTPGTLVPAVSTPNPSSTPYQGSKLAANASSLNRGATVTRAPLPRPVLPRQRTYLDRFVDFVVGDGPANRYALICRNCDSHNGMALKEEFEYFAFRCCYCNFWNPARKQKPSAPKLQFNTTHVHSLSASNASEHMAENADIKTLKLPQVETSSPSDTDSDIEVVERPTEIPGDSEHIAQPAESETDGKDVTDDAESKSATADEESEKTIEKMDVDES